MRKLALFGIVAGLFLAGCSDDDGGNGNNNINNQNLSRQTTVDIGPVSGALVV